MDMDSVLKPRGKFVFRDIAGESILVPVRGGVSEMDSIFTLNETGAMIWKGIEAGRPVGKIVQTLQTDFEIETSEAEREVREFLDLLIERRLIESSEAP